MEDVKQNMENMMKSTYGNEKLSKEKELNPSMTISGSAPDEFENKMHSLGGGSTNG